MSNIYEGTIKKLHSTLNNDVHYSLPIGPNLVELNPLINKKVKFSFTGDIHCIKCNNKIKKTFAQGYCFPCFRDAPETSECILRPELCRAHEGESRDVCLGVLEHYKPKGTADCLPSNNLGKAVKASQSPVSFTV